MLRHVPRGDILSSHKSSYNGVIVRKSGLRTLGTLLPRCRNGISYVCVSPPCGANGISRLGSISLVSRRYPVQFVVAIRTLDRN